MLLNRENSAFFIYLKNLLKSIIMMWDKRKAPQITAPIRCSSLLVGYSWVSSSTIMTVESRSIRYYTRWWYGADLSFFYLFHLFIRVILILSLASVILLADMKEMIMPVTRPKMSKGEILTTIIVLKISIRLGTTIMSGSQLELAAEQRSNIHNYYGQVAKVFDGREYIMRFLWCIVYEFVIISLILWNLQNSDRTI